ncbi:MAG TPA: tol-pal system protein YbgF [Thermoanaerobaculia bacterium]|nr:tol-pal system protein YbgF [Thermoanaerobaculia bacterium]
MKKLLPLALIVAAGCATSSDVQKLQSQITELQDQLAQVKHNAAEKSDVQSVNQKIADQTQELLKSNATLIAKVGQMEERANNTQGSIEQTNYRIDKLVQQMTQTQHDVADLQATVTRLTAPPVVTAPAAPATTTAPPPATATTAQPAAAEVTVPAPATPTENPMDVYQAAYRDYQRGNYDLALAGFRDFLQRFPDSELGANAEYWIGESLYSQQKYSDAIDQFNRVVDKYPKSDKAPGALLKKGYAYLAMNDRPRAIVQFQYVVHEYPNSRESALAKERLKQLGIDTK